MLGNLIGGFVVILVGTALLPTVANQVALSQGNGSLNATNLTSAASTLVGLSTLFYALAVSVTAIGVAASGLKNAGLM